MFVRRKSAKGRDYYQVVEGFRDAEGKVRHRNIAALGRSPTIQGAIDATTSRLRAAERALEKHHRLWPGSSPLSARVRRERDRLERQLARHKEKLVALRAATEAV